MPITLVRLRSPERAYYFFKVDSTQRVSTTLSQNIADDMSVDIRETEVSSLEPVDEFLVVNPEEVEHCCVEIVDMHNIFNGIVT